MRWAGSDMVYCAATACRVVDSRGLSRGGSVDVGAAFFAPQVGRGRCGWTSRCLTPCLGPRDGPTVAWACSAVFASMLQFAKLINFLRRARRGFALLVRSCCKLSVSTATLLPDSSGVQPELASLRAASNITDFLTAIVARTARRSDKVGPWPPAAKREKRAASAAPAAAAGAVFDWRWSRSGPCSPPSS